MTTATDHKNNLNRSTIKKTYSRTLRVETIANSAGGTAAVAMVAQPSTGFLKGCRSFSNTKKRSFSNTKIRSFSNTKNRSFFNTTP